LLPAPKKTPELPRVNDCLSPPRSHDAVEEKKGKEARQAGMLPLPIKHLRAGCVLLLSPPPKTKNSSCKACVENAPPFQQHTRIAPSVVLLPLGKCLRAHRLLPLDQFDTIGLLLFCLLLLLLFYCCCCCCCCCDVM